MNENKKSLYSLLIVATICAIAINAFFLFGQDFVKVYDNNLAADGESLITSKSYTELLSDNASISSEVIIYLLDEDYSSIEDSKTYEMMGAAGAIFGTAVMLIGFVLMLKKKDAKVICIGSGISCVAIFVLKHIITTIESSLRNSLLGTLSMLMGGSVVFNSTADTWLLLSLLCFGVIGILTYLYHKNDKIQVITVQTNADNAPDTYSTSPTSSSNDTTIQTSD